MTTTYKILAWANSLLVVVALIAVGNINNGSKLGGLVHNIQETFDEGIAVDGTEVISGTGDITTTDDLIVTDDATVSGGNLTVTTSNSATSTASLGCIQTTATSTATPVKVRFSIASTTLTTAGVTSNGLMAWSYGNCP